MKHLIFTVAQNGYAFGYSACIRSHERYAERLGCDYVCVSRPLRVKAPALAAWLKIPLLLHALKNGREWVAFLDADCMVRETAPDFTSVAMSGKSIYAA